jgi:hypothetical protein
MCFDLEMIQYKKMKKINFTILVFVAFVMNAQTTVTKNLGDFSIL